MHFTSSLFAGDGLGGPAPAGHVPVPLGHLRRLGAAAGAGDPRRLGGTGGVQHAADADAWRAGLRGKQVGKVIRLHGKMRGFLGSNWKVGSGCKWGVS